MSSLEDDEDPPPSVKSTKSSRTSDEISVKREIGAAKSPFSTAKNQLPVERDILGPQTAAFFQNQSPTSNHQLKGPSVSYFNRGAHHAALKAPKFGNANPNSPAFNAQTEYLNNYYRHHQEFTGKGDANYVELQKIVGRPQHSVPFGNQHHKNESK